LVSTADGKSEIGEHNGGCFGAVFVGKSGRKDIQQDDVWDDGCERFKAIHPVGGRQDVLASSNEGNNRQAGISGQQVGQDLDDYSRSF